MKRINSRNLQAHPQNSANKRKTSEHKTTLKITAFNSFLVINQLVLF